MATEYSILRNKMLDFVRRDKEGKFNVLSTLRSYFRGQNIELDDADLKMVQQIIHEFYLEGIVIPGATLKTETIARSGTLNFPHYQLTEYGEKVVSAQEYQPHDSDGYLARIKTEIPEIDEVIIRYLEECLSCFRKNLLLAAAVMLGCATEKAILLFVQAYGESIPNDGEKRKYENETKSYIISRKWKALWKRLEPEAAALPNQLGEDIGTIVERIFDIIRTTRNDAGHPTGRIIEKEIVHANLLLFPMFSNRVYGLIRHFSPQ
jgi:hypothetical protein